MSTAEIVSIIEHVTGIDARVAGTNHAEAFARYLCVVMAHEEGIKPPVIARLTGVGRPHVYTLLKRVDDLLRLDKEFKALYLACIARMAELEETI